VIDRTRAALRAELVEKKRAVVARRHDREIILPQWEIFLRARRRWMVQLLRHTSVAIALTAQFTQTTAAQSVAIGTQPIDERSPLSVGLYAGELDKSQYTSILYLPQDIRLSPSYLMLRMSIIEFISLRIFPIQFEGEFDIAKRFHGAIEFDIVLAPFVRWTSFPWNKLLYTNARPGAVGYIAYTSGVSA
jgi:hypothetical protein